MINAAASKWLDTACWLVAKRLLPAANFPLLGETCIINYSRLEKQLSLNFIKNVKLIIQRIKSKFKMSSIINKTRMNNEILQPGPVLALTSNCLAAAENCIRYSYSNSEFTWRDNLTTQWDINDWIYKKMEMLI